MTDDGSVMLGVTGEEVSSHWFEIIPAQEHPKCSTIDVGVTEDASIPGELIAITADRASFATCRWPSPTTRHPRASDERWRE